MKVLIQALWDVSWSLELRKWKGGPAEVYVVGRSEGMAERTNQYCVPGLNSLHL